MRRQFYRAFFLEIKFFGAPKLPQICIHSAAQKGLILKKRGAEIYLEYKPYFWAQAYG